MLSHCECLLRSDLAGQSSLGRRSIMLCGSQHLMISGILGVGTFVFVFLLGGPDPGPSDRAGSRPLTERLKTLRPTPMSQNAHKVARAPLQQAQPPNSCDGFPDRPMAMHPSGVDSIRVSGYDIATGGARVLTDDSLYLSDQT